LNARKVGYVRGGRSTMMLVHRWRVQDQSTPALLLVACTHTHTNTRVPNSEDERARATSPHAHASAWGEERKSDGDRTGSSRRKTTRKSRRKTASEPPGDKISPHPNPAGDRRTHALADHRSRTPTPSAEGNHTPPRARRHTPRDSKAAFRPDLSRALLTHSRSSRPHNATQQQARRHSSARTRWTESTRWTTRRWRELVSCVWPRSGGPTPCRRGVSHSSRLRASLHRARAATSQPRRPRRHLSSCVCLLRAPPPQLTSTTDTRRQMSSPVWVPRHARPVPTSSTPDPTPCRGRWAQCVHLVINCIFSGQMK
jgi:hypothetical protein